MTKTAKLKSAPAAVKSDKMIDPSKYEATTYVDPVTGKTKHSRGTGDAVQIALLHVGTNDKMLKDVAKENELDYDPANYANAGMAKMALSNRLRALVKKGVAVTIGAHVVKKLDQKISPPKAAA